MMKLHLKTFIYKGNEIEKENAVKLMYQLCFDEIIAKDVGQDEQMLNFLNEIIKDESYKRNQLKRYCNGVLFMINTRGRENPVSDTHVSAPEIKTEASQPVETAKHIMISYNRESRDLCLKIKSELEKLNYVVWIDVEDIRGSSLESMANAIEESKCVLMGMTEQYKLSSNCRLEAEYAVQLNKPIIPLILQKNYKPDGWYARFQKNVHNKFDAY